MRSCKAHREGKLGDVRCRVFLIGYGRTASRSVCRAVKLLGIKTASGFIGCRVCEQDAIKKYVKGEIDFDIYKIYDCVGAVADIHWRRLAEFYPDVKFILSVRPVEEWIGSWTRKKTSHRRQVRSTLTEPINWSGLIRLRNNGMVNWNESVWKESYLKHNQQVIDTIEKKRLLVINPWEMEDVDMWRDLADFLDVPIPNPLPPYPRIERGGKV